MTCRRYPGRAQPDYNEPSPTPMHIYIQYRVIMGTDVAHTFLSRDFTSCRTQRTSRLNSYRMHITYGDLYVCMYITHAYTRTPDVRITSFTNAIVCFTIIIHLLCWSEQCTNCYCARRKITIS